MDKPKRDHICKTCDKAFFNYRVTSRFCSIRCYGDSIKKLKTPENASEWFWPYVDKSSEYGCWEWNGTIKPNGYGNISSFNGKRNVLAHRVSFLIHNGKYPDGVTRHTCDNKKCVNPRHLIEGTIADNWWDAIERGKSHIKSRKKSRITAQEVIDIRNSDPSIMNIELAEKYSLADSTISRIRTGKAYTNI